MIKRLYIYLHEMFPLWRSLLLVTVTFYAAYLLLASINHINDYGLNFTSFIGISTSFLFLLFLRISDEFKDEQSDKLLFPERPFPSGRVKRNDLKTLMSFTVISMVILNFFVGRSFIYFIILFSYGLLMYKYFFVPQYISQNLILALVTHNPVTIIMNIYLISIFCFRYNIPLFTWDNLVIVFLFWLPSLAWELSRKVKAPQYENEYTTYSKIFGYKLAALLPLIMIIIHHLVLISLEDTANLSMWFILFLTIIFLFLLFFYLRFIFKPNERTSSLKPITELYMLVTQTGILVNMIINILNARG